MPVRAMDVDQHEGDFEATSVAKGVFAFKKGVPATRRDPASSGAKKRKGSSGRKRGRAASKGRKEAQDDDGKEDDPYASAWKRASRIVLDLQQKTFAEVLDAVVGHASSSSSGGVGANAFGDRPIRACALLTGVNLPDHDFLFGLLASRLRAEVGPHVAALRASGAGAAASVSQRALVRSAVAQLMLVEGPGLEEDEDSDEEDEAPDVKAANLNLPVLESWYNNQYPSTSSKSSASASPRKKSKKDKASAASRPPLVIILEDFEGFSAHVLQDFILSLSEYSSSLPFLLVFGVATTVSAVHLKLPHHVSSCLSIETFSGQRATELMAKVVERVVMDPGAAFKLGGRCLGLLLEIFLFSDFSVKKFMLAYKYCLLEHYTRSPVVPLLCVSDPAAARRAAAGLDRDQLDRARSLPSFRRYVEADVAGRAGLLVDDRRFAESLASGLAALRAAADRLGRFAAGLHAVAGDLPGAPLGRQLYSVYHLCLKKGEVAGSHEYREAFEFLAHLSPANLRAKLVAFKDCLEGSEDHGVKKVIEKTEEFLGKLDDLSETQGASESALSSAFSSPTAKRGSASAASSPGSPASSSPRTKLTRVDLQRRLLEQTLERRRLLNPFDALRREALDFLHSALAAGTRSPAAAGLPFRELVWYDDHAAVARHLLAFPRGVVKAALTDPGAYLGDDVGASAPLPDVAVAYRLHTEAGRLINLYDWLQSWLSVVNRKPADAEEEESEEGDPDEVDPVDQARFTQAVSSLQFLGFVKPSKRKTDHVAKLTWGE